MTGPKTPFAEQIHAEKYRAPGEGFKEAMSRIAGALTSNPTEFNDFRDLLTDMRFLPAGRVQAAVGAIRRTTAHNCLAGDVEILTREYGSVPIAHVAGESVTLLDGNGAWVPCVIHDHGMQETGSVKFNGGFESIELRSTANHGWVTAKGCGTTLSKSFLHGHRKFIADLRPTKLITDEQDYKRGVVHGIMYGDGSKTRDGAFNIRVCSHHESIEAWLDGVSKTYPQSNNGDPLYYFPRAVAWCDFKERPDAVRASLDYLLGFFRGWFAADGCVSMQPHANICGGPDELVWIKKWGPLVGWHALGACKLAQSTNFGPRTKESMNIHFKKSSMCVDDFLIAQHKERWTQGHCGKVGHSWRVHGAMKDFRIENVYCPVVPTTHSFALACGIHSANCFISGTIGDSFVVGHDSIMARAGEAASTMRMGGGIGYDFSTLRPRGALIKKLQSKSSGPVSFMEIFDAVGRAASSAGHRRGAQMGVLRVDHPDVEEFIHVKNNREKLTGFNMSLGITDKFMHAVDTGAPFELKFGGQVYKEIDAQALWDVIMRSTWDWAEPGVLFIDTINRLNNLWYCETIAATNPCGEQPLPPHGACLLGSFNLVKYISLSHSFEWEQFRRDVRVAVGAMDRVTDVSIYPLHEQEQEAIGKRRMGLGVTGLANAVEAMGWLYGSPQFLDIEAQILDVLRDESYQASMLLARERGSFPLFSAGDFANSEFVKTLPHELQADIVQNGIRNSHLTSIAPTGTISMAADNVSSGIEPVFSLRQKRIVNMSDGPQEIEINDYGLENFGSVNAKTVEQVTVQEHLDVLVTAALRVDSAVSKTCNVPSTTPWADFKSLYVQAYERGAKGCTTYRVGGKRGSILTAAPDEACAYDPATGVRSCE